MTFKIEFGTQPHRSVVQVYFEEKHFSLAYYNDSFDLHVGDIVYVEGKQEGMRGRVSSINYNFKIKLSDYKRVIAVADTSVHGKFFMAGSHFISFEREAIPCEKVRAWFIAPTKEGEEFISGSDGEESFPLDKLEKMNVTSAIVERGHECYLNNKVKYICIDGTKGYAIVEGTRNYEVEFKYLDGNISALTCSCFCSYNCKHSFATMLQLKETLEIISKNYSEEYERAGYFAAITKEALFTYAIDGKEGGNFTL